MKRLVSLLRRSDTRDFWIGNYVVQIQNYFHVCYFQVICDIRISDRKHGIFFLTKMNGYPGLPRSPGEISSCASTVACQHWSTSAQQLKWMGETDL